MKKALLTAVLLILASPSAFAQFYNPITAPAPVLTQLNNLQIQSISFSQFGALAAITASGTQEVQCFAYPCFPQPVTYTIRVYQHTTLLQRDRARTTLSAFTVGDHINVYGALNRASSVMDAQIMRNLDKPTAIRFLQLNNAQIVTAPGPFRPTTFTVTQPNINTCFDYGFGNQRPVLIPCPHGAENVQVDPLTLYYPAPRQYTVTIGPTTSVLDRNRQPIPLSSLVPGDFVNVYGAYSDNASRIEAIIVRNLSRPAAFPIPLPIPMPTPPPTSFNRAPVITNVSGPTNLAAGNSGTWSISAYDPDGDQLSYSVDWADQYLYGQAQTSPSHTVLQNGTFTHTYYAAGSYTITFTVRDRHGQSAVATLTTRVSGSVSAPFISVLTPQYGPVGTYVQITGSGFTQTDNTIYFGQGAIMNAVSNDGRTLSFVVPAYIGPYCPIGTFCPAIVYEITPGTYPVSVGNSNGRTSNLNFTVQ